MLAVLCAHGAAAFCSTFASGQTLTPFVEEGALRGLVYPIPTPQQIGIYGYGSGFVDLDEDGDPDIVALGRLDGTVGIWENDGTGMFLDRSATSGIPPLVAGSAFCAGDWDGDGRTDLFISQIDAPCLLLRNLGGFTFADATVGSGINVAGPVKAPSFADFDLDGDLDLFVPIYRNATPGGVGKVSSLFRNNGNGTFTDVAAANGLAKPAYTFTGVWTDYDLDGDVDFYVSNDRGHLPPFFQENQFFRNDNGTLVEVFGNGADVPLFSMGVAVGDIDGNGYPDFYCTNLPNANQPTGGANPLLLNQGNGTFVRNDAAWGVGSFASSWGTELFDFDNNGSLELYVNNQFITNRFYLNTGVLPMPNIAGQINAPGSQFFSYASSAADIDNDGDLDLLVGDLGVSPLLYVNREGSERASVRLRFVGSKRNPWSIGATALVKIQQPSPTIFRDVSAGGRSYLGHSMPEIHVGMGSARSLHRVDIRWPIGTAGGASRTITNVPPGSWTIYPKSMLGDVDGNGVIDGVDRLAFDEALIAGWERGREMFDMDGDCDIDGDDAAIFDRRASDFDNDGIVGPADLAFLLGGWGLAVAVCDLDDDGVVGPSDLAAVLGAWGPVGL